MNGKMKPLPNLEKLKPAVVRQKSKLMVTREIESLLGDGFALPPSMFHATSLYGLKQLHGAIKKRVNENGFRKAFE